MEQEIGDKPAEEFHVLPWALRPIPEAGRGTPSRTTNSPTADSSLVYEREGEDGGVRTCVSIVAAGHPETLERRLVSLLPDTRCSLGVIESAISCPEMTPQRHECHVLAQGDKQRKGPRCLMAEAQQSHTAHSRLFMLLTIKGTQTKGFGMQQQQQWVKN